MKERFGVMPDGQAVHRFVLSNPAMRVAVLEIGAAVQSVEVADRAGRRANVVLGLATLEDYRLRSPHFGAVPGRTAGRIAGGRFTLDGQEHVLPANDGPNTLHGGPQGFGRRAWTATEHGDAHVVLELVSADGDQGYPGAVRVQLRYALEGAALSLDFEAETTKPTLLNLTNHSYFNLAGEGSGEVGGHLLALRAEAFLPVDGAGLPTGEVRRVAGTVFDFRTERPLGTHIRSSEPQMLAVRGYDHTFMLDGGGGLRDVATLLDPGSGRRLTVATTAPAMQLYTGNSLTGALYGPSGRAYRQTDAVCLEAQHPPDSIHHPHLPQSVLRPGETFRLRTVFRFDTVA